MTQDKPAVTSAKDYKKQTDGVTAQLPSGAVFRVRVLTMPEFMTISKELQRQFPKDMKAENIMTAGTDLTHPDIVMAYSKLALPVCVLEPSIVAEESQTDENSVWVGNISPLDLIRLNMLSITASPGVRQLLASFLSGESSIEELDRLRSMVEKAPK